MRDLTYKEIIIRDLSQLNHWKFAALQAEEELETLEAEFTAIKATNFDKMPGGSGDNAQEEKLVTAIAKRDQRKAELALNKRRIADIERLLTQLPDDERLVVDKMLISQEKYAADRLIDELGYERTQIYRIKNKALMHLAQLRYGAAYRP